MLIFAAVMELADITDLKSVGQPYRFESGQRHHERHIFREGGYVFFMYHIMEMVIPDCIWRYVYACRVCDFLRIEHDCFCKNQYAPVGNDLGWNNDFHGWNRDRYCDQSHKLQE